MDYPEKKLLSFFSGEPPNIWGLIFRKGYCKTAHASRLVGKYVRKVNYQFFLKRIHIPFLKFYEKLENLKCQKLIDLILFMYLFIYLRKYLFIYLLI